MTSSPPDFPNSVATHLSVFFGAFGDFFWSAAVRFFLGGTRVKESLTRSPIVFLLPERWEDLP